MVRKLDGTSDRSLGVLIRELPDQVEHLSEFDYVDHQRQLFWQYVGETSLDAAKEGFPLWWELVDETGEVPRPTDDWEQILLDRMSNYSLPKSTPIMVTGSDKDYDPNDIKARHENRTQAMASTEYGSCLPSNSVGSVPSAGMSEARQRELLTTRAYTMARTRWVAEMRLRDRTDLSEPEGLGNANLTIAAVMTRQAELIEEELFKLSTPEQERPRIGRTVPAVPTQVNRSGFSGGSII